MSAERDPLMAALANLPLQQPPEELSKKLRAAGHARLVPARVHALWGLAIALSAVVYLTWALLYTSVV